MQDSKLYHVFDDVFTDDQLAQLKIFSINTLLGGAGVLYLPKNCSQLNPILEKARECFDLSSTLYYEIWEQNNTLPGGYDDMGWHCDDDVTLHQYNIIKYPLCTTIYYMDVDKDLSDGKLVIQDHKTCKYHRVQPKSNRLVIFGPGILHTVEEYSGYRHSIICNPWDRPLSLIEGV